MPRRNPKDRLPTSPDSYHTWLDHWKFILDHPGWSVAKVAGARGVSVSIIRYVKIYGQQGQLTDERAESLEPTYVRRHIAMKELTDKADPAPKQEAEIQEQIPEPRAGRPTHFNGVEICAETMVRNLRSNPQPIGRLFGPHGPIGFSCLDCAGFMHFGKAAVMLHRVNEHGAKPGKAISRIKGSRQTTARAQPAAVPDPFLPPDPEQLNFPRPSLLVDVLPEMAVAVPEPATTSYREVEPTLSRDVIEAYPEPSPHLEPPSREDGTVPEFLEDLTLKELTNLVPSFQANARLVMQLQDEVEELRRFKADSKYKVETFDSLQDRYTDLLAQKAVAEVDGRDELVKLREWKANITRSLSGFSSLINEED